MTDRAGDIILLASDPAMRRGLAAALPAAQVATTPLEALADMANAPPRAIVATPRVLGYRHEPILQAVRTACPGAAVYLVCPPEDEPRAIRIAGVDDYFIAPFGLGDLVRAVSADGAARAVMAAETARQAAVRRLATDAETGLASRRYLDHYLASFCRRAAEKRREVTLALISPEGNALVGRAALAALVEMMKESFPAAKLARADEQTLAAAMAGDVRAEPVAGRLQAFAARVTEAGLPVPVAIAAAVFPWQGGSARALMDAADARLTQSRRTGLPAID